jgi:hypothetical protein
MIRARFEYTQATEVEKAAVKAQKKVIIVVCTSVGHSMHQQRRKSWRRQRGQSNGSFSTLAGV